MQTAGSYAYLPLERVVFGRPAAEAAVEEAARVGATRVFIVASKSLARNTPVIRTIADALGSRYVELFDGCVQHSPRASVIAAARAARAARPDLILTVGGGTALDTVKVLQICLAHDVDSAEALDGLHVSVGPDGKRVVPHIKPSPVRQIAVPTTLSGAEFSNLAGITDERIRQKHSFIGPDIGALAVILDPEVTLHTPEWLWLSTGVRGVDHAVETLCSIDAQPYCDGLALHALRLFAEALPASGQYCRPAHLPAGVLARGVIDHAGRLRGEPWDRPHDKSICRRAARSYILCHAAARHALQRTRNGGQAAADCGRDGPLRYCGGRRDRRADRGAQTADDAPRGRRQARAIAEDCRSFDETTSGCAPTRSRSARLTT